MRPEAESQSLPRTKCASSKQERGMKIADEKKIRPPPRIITLDEGKANVTVTKCPSFQCQWSMNPQSQYYSSYSCLTPTLKDIMTFWLEIAQWSKWRPFRNFFLNKVPLKVKENSCCKTLFHTIITVEVDGNEKGKYWQKSPRHMKPKMRMWVVLWLSAFFFSEPIAGHWARRRPFRKSTRKTSRQVWRGWDSFSSLYLLSQQ